ncbi:hypothetical protein D3C84_961240 [compost metagenome]
MSAGLGRKEVIRLGHRPRFRLLIHFCLKGDRGEFFTEVFVSYPVQIRAYLAIPPGQVVADHVVGDQAVILGGYTATFRQYTPPLLAARKYAQHSDPAFAHLGGLHPLEQINCLLCQLHNHVRVAAAVAVHLM